MGLLPLGKQENMFCQWRGGVGWPHWLQAGPPARPSAGRQPVVVGVKSWLTSRLFPPAGEEAPSLGPQPNPLSQQGNNGLDGLGGWMEGQPSLFPAPTSDWDRLLGGLVPPHLPTPSCFAPCWAYCLPSAGPRKTEGSGNVSGLLLGYRRAGGGDERETALHRLRRFCLGL